MPQGDVEPVLGPALGTSCDPVDLLYDQQVERLERSLPLGKLDSIASVRFLDSSVSVAPSGGAMTLTGDWTGMMQNSYIVMTRSYRACHMSWHRFYVVLRHDTLLFTVSVLSRGVQ